MSQIDRKLIDLTFQFSKKEWEEWIWERTHGVDTMTNSLEKGDSYSYQILLKVYDQIVIRDNIKAKEYFIKSLIKIMAKSLQKCQKLLDCKVENNQFSQELLALEDCFNIVNHFHDTELEKIKANGLLQICKQVYNFIYRNQNEYFLLKKYGSLRRIVLLVRFRLEPESIILDDFERELNYKETFRVAFNCLFQKYNFEAIGKYLPNLVNTAFQVRKEVFIKLELQQLKQKYFIEHHRQLEQELIIALKKIQEQSQEQYEFLEKELNKLGLVACETPEEKLIKALCLCVPKESISSPTPSYFDYSHNHTELATDLFIFFCKRYPERYSQYMNCLLKLEQESPNAYDLRSMINKLLEVKNDFLPIIAEHFDEINLYYKHRFIELLCFQQKSLVRIFPNTKNNDYIGEIYLQSCPRQSFPLKVKDIKERDNLAILIADRAGVSKLETIYSLIV